jgi:4-alpha-glucanotransferase
MYRIDHVIGLFRIWAIPIGHPEIIGKFIPEDPALWIPQGKETLEMMITASPMLPIAEDLGFVQPIIRACLAELGIPGTKVMRWERLWDQDKSFIPYHAYPVISMTCVSTHDSPTLVQWWNTQPEEVQAFCAFKGWIGIPPQLTQEMRKEILWDSHHTASLFHINLLQEYLALFPELVWPNPEDERINIPGKVLPTNWTYRFKPSVETLISHQGLQGEISRLLSDNISWKTAS